MISHAPCGLADCGKTRHGRVAVRLGKLFLRDIFSLAEPEVPILVLGAPGSANRLVENLFLNTTPVAETADVAGGWDSVWESNDFRRRPDLARFDVSEPPSSLYLWQKRLVCGAAR